MTYIPVIVEKYNRHRFIIVLYDGLETSGTLDQLYSGLETSGTLDQLYSFHYRGLANFCGVYGRMWRNPEIRCMRAVNAAPHNPNYSYYYS